MRRRPLLLAALAVAAALGAGLWSAVVWVPRDGAVWGWSPGSGLLRVPRRGLALLPRWSGSRLVPSELAAELVAATSDEANVTVRTTLRPPPGAWRLAPAQTPTEGLRKLIDEPLRRQVGNLPVECFMTRPTRSGCPQRPAEGLRGLVAAALRMPEEAVEVALEPDPAAVNAKQLATIAAGLEIPRHRVLVLALDALDWDLILPLLHAGRLPNLARLTGAGVWGEMETLIPMLSPLIWTTVATGVNADVHGVLDFVETDPVSGQPLPISGRSRRVPAIWNLASALGLEVGVVGWWATWPAERVHGTMVSDRLYYTLQQGIPEQTFREDPPHLVFPVDRTDEMTELRDRAVQEVDWRLLSSFMDVPEERFNQAVSADEGMEDPVDGLRRILGATRTYLGAGLVVAGSHPDLMMVYLEGTDTIGHLLAPYLPPPTIDVDPAEAAMYAAAVPKYFEAVDRWIGRYLEACPLSDYVVLVLSDHGFTWHKDRPTRLSGTAGPTAPLWHATDAVFLVAGPGIPRLGHVEQRPSVLDVAPTLAALLGIPADASWRTGFLPGVSATAVAPIDWAPLVPPASYRQDAPSLPEDREYLEKLRALGYIGENGTSAGAATPAPTSGAGQAAAAPPAATPLPPTVTRAELNNLALIRINEKKYDEAERLLRQAIAMSPDYAAPHYNLRRIYMETKQYDRADEELWNSVDKGLRDPERSVDRAAKDYDSLDLSERTDTLLTRAIQHFPEHEPFYVHLLVVKLRRDRCAEGLPTGREAAAKFPLSGPVHAFFGLAAACAGEPALARQELERSLAINPAQPQLRQALKELP